MKKLKKSTKGANQARIKKEKEIFLEQLKRTPVVQVVVDLHTHTDHQQDIHILHHLVTDMYLQLEQVPHHLDTSMYIVQTLIQTQILLVRTTQIQLQTILYTYSIQQTPMTPE